jgi:putative Ca2+/H+ antiporter (TMEM165/GDT1 family)
MTAFINSFLLVVVGEMGDKTQLLAMGMASKYKAKDVMIGVFIATLLNHALAVLVGSYLSSIIPMGVISIVAGVSFLVFGLWTIRGDVDDGSHKVSRFGPILTVGIAFFLAEMGDKTQLMTVTLGAEYRQPFFILMGTTLGMVVADGIGVFFGAWICKYLSQRYIKWIAGLVFLFFGSVSLYNNLPAGLITPLYIALYLIALGALIYLAGFKYANRPPQPCESTEVEGESTTVIATGPKEVAIK